MSEEDKELMARISEVAGRINRHKNQQSSVNPPLGGPATRHQYISHRHTPGPYMGRGYRVGRQPAPHRHRTLHLNHGNSPGDSTPSTPGASGNEASWVHKTDRHMQLINVNVYEQKTQARSKAIEETRQLQQTDRKRKEKSLIRAFLQSQASAAPSSSTGNGNTQLSATIVVDGAVFTVRRGGQKLVRATDNLSSAPPTPKTTLIAGVRFNRTKTGNLVSNRVIKEHRCVSTSNLRIWLTKESRNGSVKKKDELCKIFSTTGSCPKGPSCRYMHDAHKVAICKDFLKDGRCANGKDCDLSHAITPERVPNCLHYAKGHCTKPDCPYTHSKASPGAPVCERFGFYGYCDKGADCTERHVFECPNFSNTGICKIKGCKLPHRERASVLRNQEKIDEALEDVSSDDDEYDTDDVDSDAVSEFIDADSNESDIEDGADFIPLS